MAEFSTFEKTGLFPIDKKRCISDEDQKSLRIWKDRVRRYFSKIDQKALDYRVNDDNTGVKVMERSSRSPSTKAPVWPWRVSVQATNRGRSNTE